MVPFLSISSSNNFTKKEDQIVLINTKFDAIVDVEVLASAFNMSKADFIGRRVLVDDFGGLDNVLCAVVDKNWFMVYDKLIKTKRKENEQGLYYNIFLHHWQTLSTSIFENAVLFVTVAPTLTEITITPQTATVPTGFTQQLNVEVTGGTNNPPSKVKWIITGATDSSTFISSTGLLYIGKNETGTTGDITVTATSVYNDLISDSATITIG